MRTIIYFFIGLTFSTLLIHSNNILSYNSGLIVLLCGIICACTGAIVSAIKSSRDSIISELKSLKTNNIDCLTNSESEDKDNDNLDLNKDNISKED